MFVVFFYLFCPFFFFSSRRRHTSCPLVTGVQTCALPIFTLNPAHPGTWQWIDDKSLSFEPAEDWPVGQAFKGGFAKKRLIAGHQRLDTYEFAFTAPAFEATIKGTEFHQDPQVATDKKAVLTLRFSHPVRSEEHTSELQTLMRISKDVFCWKKK